MYKEKFVLITNLIHGDEKGVKENSPELIKKFSRKNLTKMFFRERKKKEKNWARVVDEQSFWFIQSFEKWTFQ